MPDYAVPGMKVEERDRNPHPITGVSTSTAAFIGFAPSGPFMPTPITSPTEYQLASGSPNGTGFVGGDLIRIIGTAEYDCPTSYWEMCKVRRGKSAYRL
jgi:hypothetical protein